MLVNPDIAPIFSRTDELAALHAQLLTAERDDPMAPVVIQSLWLLTFLYSRAPPTYAGPHRHPDVLHALSERNGAAVRQACVTT